MESKDLLNELAADRASLADRVRTPPWLPVGFGLVAAAYVAIPSFVDDAARNLVLIAAVVASILLIAGYRRATGIRVSGFGGVPWLIFGFTVLLVLGLLSVSFALASLGLHWWIAAPAVAAFATVAALTLLFTTSARERMRNAR